jgi:acyl-coenzyme A synthetase/AMP-(fatty) acid ligase
VTGELALAVPCLGVSQRLLNKDHRQAYYEGMPKARGGHWFLRRHGDEMERLPGGAYRALGRVDDTMNLGGIKVSSGKLVVSR